MSFHCSVSLRLMRLVAVGVLIGTSALAQPRGGQETVPPPASFSATSIPGVVPAGAKIELVKAGVGGTQCPVATHGGSLLGSSANRLLKIESSGKLLTFLPK